MKLLFVTANLGSGGAERVTSLLANQFCQKGYEVEIIFFRNWLVFYELDERVKTIVIGEECHSDIMWRKMLWLRNYVKKEKPDVVIPFRVSVYCTTILSLLGLSVPILASERIDPHIPDSYWTYLRKLLLPFVKHLVVQTEYIKSYYPKFIQKKTSIIYNPVNDEVFHQIENGELIIENEGRPNRIISVGRLYPQKNQAMMIRAFAKVADEFPDWQLVIYGEGPLRAELEFLVSSFKLQNRVLLPGRTEHVIEELRKSRIFCMSSDYEGLSNAVVEAFCIGLPIITTKVSGTEDFINEGENGFLLDIGDVDGMEKAMRILMSNEVLRRKMGGKNRLEADQFEMKRIFQQWVDVVNNVVNHKS